MELLNQLTQNLGIDENQAKGGAGLLFKFAKDKLSGDEFSKVAGAVPGITDLINAAPSDNGDSGGGLLGGLTSALGDNMGGLASLAGGFSKLNLDSDMIGKFIPVILSFVQAKGGDGISGILSKVLNM